MVDDVLLPLQLMVELANFVLHAGHEPRLSIAAWIGWLGGTLLGNDDVARVDLINLSLEGTVRLREHLYLILVELTLSTLLVDLELLVLKLVAERINLLLELADLQAQFVLLGKRVIPSLLRQLEGLMQLRGLLALGL